MNEKKEELTLEDLKENYEILRAKHDLPSFKELNEDFMIEKLSSIETDYLIRGVRHCIAEKFLNYLRWIETILNPQQSSLFMYSLIKSVTSEQKKRLSEIYWKLCKDELLLIELDTLYVEEKEIKFVKEFYASWKDLSRELAGIVGELHKSVDSKKEKNSNGYFG